MGRSSQRDTVTVFLQAELIVGDQSGAIHIWDLKTDHNEQLIPEPEVSVNSVHIDPDASYMAAVNSSVSLGMGWDLQFWVVLVGQSSQFPCTTEFCSAVMGRRVWAAFG